MQFYSDDVPPVTYVCVCVNTFYTSIVGWVLGCLLVHRCSVSGLVVFGQWQPSLNENERIVVVVIILQRFYIAWWWLWLFGGSDNSGVPDGRKFAAAQSSLEC